jgi:hypothetical protein
MMVFWPCAVYIAQARSCDRDESVVRAKRAIMS